MNNVRVNANHFNTKKMTLSQLKGLRTAMEQISFKMNTFATKYYKLIHLIEKVDGKDKIPASLKGIEDKIGIIRGDLMGVISIFFQDMDITVFGLAVCARSCETLCNRYEETIDDLLTLYTEKERIMDGMQVTNNSNSMEMIDDKIRGNKNTDYKREAMKMLDLFNNFGIIDESELKTTHGRHINLDQKGKDCLKSLNDIVHNLSPTSVSANDITRIKEILKHLSRLEMLDEDGKNREYDDIEKYIGELAGRDLRVTREEGEDLSSTETYDKLEAMKILGLFNEERVTDEDLLDLVQISKDNLDEVSLKYLEGLVEVINDISPSELLAEDAIRIRDAVIKLGEMNALDEETRRKEFEDLDDFMEELSNKQGRNK